jgi:hypothetical protein
MACRCNAWPHTYVCIAGTGAPARTGCTAGALGAAAIDRHNNASVCAESKPISADRRAARRAASRAARRIGPVAGDAVRPICARCAYANGFTMAVR